MTLYYLFIVCSFLAVALAVEGLYLAWDTSSGPEAQRIVRRLRAVSAGEHGTRMTALMKRRVLSELPQVERLLMKLPRVHRLDRILLQAGSTMTVGNILLISALFATIGLMIPLLFGLPGALSLPFALGLATLPFLRLIQVRRQRLKKFEAQLPDTLDLIARAMRAGHSFPSSLGMVSSEATEPTSGEFRTTFDEINFGISTQEALLSLASRVPSTDLSYFVIAVLIQHETGGNLAELLDTLARLIRQRFHLQLKVRALSAEGRISAWILSVLPFFLVTVLIVINPDFISILWTDPVGLKLVAGGLFLIVAGIFWMWRLIKIRT